MIPARGGSKGVPGKNLIRVGGVSLVARAVRACRAAQTIDAVYVSTDDADIAKAAAEAGAGVISRPAELAGDTASSESALEHALGYLDWVDVATDIVVFVQCTSPFIDPATLDRGVRIVARGRGGFGVLRGGDVRVPLARHAPPERWSWSRGRTTTGRTGRGGRTGCRTTARPAPST